MATTLEINGSRYLKGIFRIIAIAAFAIACWAGTAAAQTAEAVAAAINNYSSGTGSLSATVTGNTVTVTGEIVGDASNTNTTLTLNIPAEVTVLWQATLVGHMATGNLNLVWFNGSGKLEVAKGGRIEVVGGPLGNTVFAVRINEAGTVIVSGGTVKSTSVAIWNQAGALNVSGGEVSATGANGRAIVGAFAAGTITISQADPGTPTLISGNTSSTNGTISVDGPGTATERLVITGGTVENTASGNAIRSTATAGSVRISGGTVRAATGSAIVNTNVGTITISQADPGTPTLITSRNTSNTNGTVLLEGSFTTAERLIITGGTVENTASGNAVRNTSNGSVRISGGMVRAAEGLAVSSNNATSGLTINGTALVLAHGTAIANVVDRTGIAPADNSAIIVLNYTAGGTYMGAQGLVSSPANIARWDIRNEQAGIAYVRGVNTGFIEVPGVTVALSPVKPIATSPILPYNGQEQSPGIAPSNFYTISGDKATEIGDYVATVALNDKNNYEWENGTNTDLTLPWSIVMGDGASAPDYTAPVPLFAEPGETLDDIDLPTGWAWDEDLATPVGGLGENRHKATFTSINGNYNTAVADWAIYIGEDIAGSFSCVNFLAAVRQAIGKAANIPIFPEDLKSVTNLPLDIRNIASLDGIEYFTALEILSVSNNQLSSINVSNNTALRTLSVSNNQLSSINVSNNTALTFLSVSNNQLSFIDVSKNTVLTRLEVFGNHQLSFIDVSKNTALYFLDVGDNQLSSIDVSKNTALTYLSVSNNQLSTIDVSKNTALEWLDVDNNQLSTIDVSKNTALIVLDVRLNYMLSEADVVGLNESITTEFFYFLPQRSGKRPISIAFSDGSATYTGSEHSHETATVASPNFLERANPQWTYTYTAITGTLGPASKPLAAGTYSVKARYEDDGNAGEATVTFTIDKALGTTAPDYEPPTDLAAIEDQTLEEVQLPPGWAWDEAPTTPVGEIGPNPHKATFTSANPNYSIVANINWTINVSAKLYTITFDSDGGSAVDEQTIAKGGKIDEPAEPTKEGFTFLGWLSDLLEKIWDFATDLVTSNTTLTAVWEAISSSSKDQSSSSETQSSSSEEAPSSSSNGETSIFANRENPKIGAIGVQTRYYNLRGTPLGTTKPTAPGVYLEKRGKYTRKIAVR